MIRPDRLREEIERLIEMLRKGQASISAAYLLAHILHPILELLYAMETNRGERWLMLDEAVERSRKSSNYFAKRLKSLGGKNRLELWASQGFAEQASSGHWLISPMMVATATRDAEGEPETDDRTQSTSPGVDEDAVFNRLKRSA
jgi:hypothetical protein